MKFGGNVLPVVPEIPSGGRAAFTPVHIFDVRSSDGVTIYKVKLFPSGAWSCPCKGFGYRGYCRHVGGLRQSFLHVSTDTDP